ncbi:uncharacterized protein LOC120349952 [Nilaparvata lugens]|uniref:uncharacterized protein LOC120349952 n=1 Tax=Nilaparvata lugens TaxID=108931 RepID=UPI00193CB1E8|nr:uncharacterized protein LOC120349952 [Nilaparvata lugens]
MTFDCFQDFSNKLWYSSIRPGNKALDATVNEVCNYIYQPDGKIKFKLGFDEQAEELPRRSKVISEEIIYPALYSDAAKEEVGQRGDEICNNSCQKQGNGV